MIRLGALFPDHLNLNGDLGNLEVISKQLEWRGLASERLAVCSNEDLQQDFDFIFVGHGSLAAWADIRSAFANLSPKLIELMEGGMPGLAISTGYEELAKVGLFSKVLASPISERISKFKIYKDGEKEVLGYVNTEVDLPILHREAKWIGSLLHGPVLAKNNDLLEEVLGNITKHAGVVFDQIKTREKASHLADLISEVWVLERELANE
jgi:CobQ-like glutamine amidotransferase family enzyme